MHPHRLGRHGRFSEDGGEHLLGGPALIYEHDDFNQMKRMLSGAEEWIYVYTAGDERVWLKRVGYGFARWTLRDLDAKLLREYTQDTTGWSASEDYLYRDGQLLATETPAGRKHFHLDHLGTPRLITNASGQKVAHHLYYPFGEEATAFTQDTERMKFTGHERDLASAGGAGDDLDYMHARHCSPVTGRFLSVDIAPGRPKKPQSWNRYVYVEGNPLAYVDPDGREGAGIILDQDNQQLLTGEITPEEFQQRTTARALGAVAGLSGTALFWGWRLFSLGESATGRKRRCPGPTS